MPLTNSRGVFSRSLAEFAVAAMLYFAKDFRRMLRARPRASGIDSTSRKCTADTVGILGFGEIGRHTARLASALGMRDNRPAQASGKRNGRRRRARIYPLEAKIEFLSEAATTWSSRRRSPPKRAA